MKDSWPSVVIVFLSVLIAAVIAVGGIGWSFQKETDRAFNMQVDIFKRYFAAVISETAENQAVINKLKREISTTHFNVQLLSNEIAGSLITNPMLYKYTGNEYLYSLRTYLATIKIANRMLNLVFDDFRSDETIMDKNIRNLNKRLDECSYYLYILQYQTQMYIHCYDVKHGPKPGNYDQIMNWLKQKEKITIEELKTKLYELGKLNEKQRLELQEGIQKVLQKDKQ